MSNYTEKESNQVVKKFEERIKNRFTVEGSSLFEQKLEYSNLFEADTTTYPNFAVLKILFTRATLGEASNFKKFMEKNISEFGRSIVVDLNSCEFIDSSFFGVLVAGLKRMKSMDKEFLLVYDSENRLPIFSATGLDKIFKVYNRVEEAISA